MIPQGRRIEVKLHAGKRLSGRMQEWRADGLVILRGKKMVSVEKSGIAQVVLVIGRSRGRKALIAGSVTGGAVAAVTGAFAARGDCCEPPAGLFVAGSAAVSGGIAAGIAALFPPHRDVIYAALPTAGHPKPSR